MNDALPSLRDDGTPSETIELGPLGYGAANVGNLYEAMTDEQAWQVLDAAWEGGIRYFDTAPHYGLGLSERRLGAFLATKPRGEFRVSTKVGRLLRPSRNRHPGLDDANQFAVPASLERVWDVSRDGVRRSLEESLERLGLEAVDVLYLHDPEEHDLTPTLASAIPALVELRAEGAVSAVGVGSKSAAALRAAAEFGGLDLVMVAGRLTLLDQTALLEVVPQCRANDVGIVAAAVFNSGVLASPSPREGARYEYQAATSGVLAQARAVEAVCRQYGVDLPTAALQYPGRCEPLVRSVVVGAATAEQVRQNVSRMSRRVPQGLWRRLVDDGLVLA